MLSAGNPAPGGKNFKNMHNPVKTIAARCLLPAMVVCGAIIPATAGAQNTQKAYTLFMGANISVDFNKSIYPVRDVNGSSWVIDIKGQEKVVSGKEGPINLKIVPALKLTEVSATIAGFRREPAYSFANDPIVRLTQGLSHGAEVLAGYQASANQANAINPNIIRPPSTNNTTTSGSSNYSASSVSRNLEAGVDASAALQARQEAAGYDAMNVEFEISSAKPLRDAFIVTMTRFHPRGSEPGTVQSLVYAKALHPIGANPTKVHFSEEGFPFDYEVLDFQLHLYDGGIEVATNVAEKRKVMTPDQAFEYVKKTYFEAHKGDTINAVPVMGELPADLASHIASGKCPKTIYVRVSKDGLAGEAFSDIACSEKIEDSYLESVVRSIRFKPALADGKPVEGVASVNLSLLETS
jgi:hypothetical protein